MRGVLDLNIFLCLFLCIASVRFYILNINKRDQGCNAIYISIKCIYTYIPDIVYPHSTPIYTKCMFFNKMAFYMYTLLRSRFYIPIHSTLHSIFCSIPVSSLYKAGEKHPSEVNICDAVMWKVNRKHNIVLDFYHFRLDKNPAKQTIIRKYYVTYIADVMYIRSLFPQCNWNS